MRIGPFRPVSRSRGALCIDDLRRVARRRLPRAVWTYVENGADDALTVADNRSAWSAWRVRQRVLAGLPDVDLGTKVADVELALPVVLAPVGLAGSLNGIGEVGAARAARAAGTRSIVSTGSTYSLEEIADLAGIGQWFQLYPCGDRQLTGSLIDGAAAAGYEAMFVTVDVPVVGNRLGERRYGMLVDPELSPFLALDYARHVRWLANLARYRRITLANLAEPGTRGSVRQTVRRQAVALRPDLSWDDLAWMRRRWKGPLYVKGILDPEDAERALAAGADGLVVSNHGGRQLSGTLPTAEALPLIVDRVNGRAQVLVDGGIRTGRDVAVALALGADAVLVGRPWAYGLAARGERGVVDVLAMLESELRRTMHLMGVADLARLTPEALLPATAPRP